MEHAVHPQQFGRKPRFSVIIWVNFMANKTAHVLGSIVIVVVFLFEKLP